MKKADEKINCLKFEYSYDEIIKTLKNGDDEEKVFAILNLDKIKCEDDFELLYKHLTNQAGSIRECVSLKILEFMPKNPPKKLIVDAVCDVNPTVSRNMVEYLKKLKDDEFIDEIKSRIHFYLDDIEKMCEKFRSNKEKNHIVTKKIFHLYWLLEAYSVCFFSELDFDMINILDKTSNFYDYTIREKTAEILKKAKNAPQNLVQKLKNDENFYVKKVF